MPVSASIPRRRLDELVVLYTVESSLRDIYVEGPTDVHVFSWFLRHHGRHDWEVRTVDTVDLPEELVETHTDDSGARGRALALAAFLDNHRSQLKQPFPIIIADRDRDHAEVDPFPSILYLTDHSCLEIYALTPMIMEKLFSVFAFKPNFNGEYLYSAVIPVLVDLFLIKKSIHERDCGCSLPSRLDRSLHFVNQTPSLDTSELIARIPVSQDTRNSINQDLLIARPNALLSPLHYIDGHHMIQIISAWLKELGADRQIYNDIAISRALYLSLDYDDLSKFRLFERLLIHTT